MKKSINGIILCISWVLNAQVALPTFQAVQYAGESALYSFSSHTFTNCGSTGNTGPTLANCKSSYNTSWEDDTDFFNVETQGVQLWTVPADGTYRIVAKGAAGGTNGFGRGGYGASLTADVSLTKGLVLAIVVGQKGTGNSSSSQFQSGTGGGGGTFVYKNSDATYYVAAAGGGGAKTATANLNSDTDDADGKYNTTSGTTINSYNNQYTAAGGTNGSGGSNSTRNMLYGGAGAGVNSNGETHPNSAHGLSRSSGWLGGTGTYYGGFGGGGGGSGTSSYKWAGGGGGYSGGGPGHNGGNGDGQYGGGGGSYYSGTLVTGTTGENSGHGEVTITKQ